MELNYKWCYAKEVKPDDKVVLLDDAKKLANDIAERATDLVLKYLKENDYRIISLSKTDLKN